MSKFARTETVFVGPAEAVDVRIWTDDDHDICMSYTDEREYMVGWFEAEEAREIGETLIAAADAAIAARKTEVAQDAAREDRLATGFGKLLAPDISREHLKAVGIWDQLTVDQQVAIDPSVLALQ